MRVLLTGATGFIGRRLARHLLARGQAFTALVRDPTSSEAAALAATGRVRIVPGELTTGAGLDDALRDADCVIHLAGATTAATSAGFVRVNTWGTRLLCAAAARQPHPPRVVHCSSLSAAGPSTPGQPRAEHQPVAPVSAYGRSKLGGEQVLRGHSRVLPGIVLRPPIVYGPGDRDFLPALTTMVRAGAVLTCGPGDRWYSLIHVDDLCRALLAATERGRLVHTGSPTDGVYHVSDGVEHNLRDIAARVATALGRRPPRLLAVPPVAAALAAWATHRVRPLRTRARLLGPDKIREAGFAAWTCTRDRAAAELGFTAEIDLAAGLDSVLAGCGGSDADRGPDHGDRADRVV